MPEQESKQYRQQVERIKKQVISLHEQYLRRTPEPKIETRVDRLEGPPKRIRFTAESS